jgi:hypothetical protein
MQQLPEVLFAEVGPPLDRRGKEESKVAAFDPVGSFRHQTDANALIGSLNFARGEKEETVTAR